MEYKICDQGLRSGRFKKNIIGMVVLLNLFLVGDLAAAEGGKASAIGALGTLTPANGLVGITGSLGTSVKELLVKQNDIVKAGSVIATFTNRPLLELEFSAVQVQLAELQANHQQNLKMLGLMRQKAAQDHNRAKVSLKQYLNLSKNAQVRSVRDKRKNDVTDALHAVRVKQSELQQTNVKYQHGLNVLQNQLKKAELNLARSQLLAPFSGVVIEVKGRVGAAAGGVLYILADLSRMMVKAEVFEGDLRKISVGQKATISSKSLPQKLVGSIKTIGRQIDVARKVATVWITLEKSEIAEKFIGMEVSVNIQP
jgi:HlyD family secretion protein